MPDCIHKAVSRDAVFKVRMESHPNTGLALVSAIYGGVKRDKA